MKKISFIVLAAILCCALVTTAYAIDGYSMYETGTVDLTQGSSKTFGAYSVQGVNLAAQTNLTSASFVNGYVTIQYSTKKCSLGGLICGNASSTNMNVASSGWVGGTWNGVQPGDYKFTFKAVSGSFKADVRMFDY